MFKDLPASLVAAVSQINQKSREAYVAEQQAIEVKKDINAKHNSMMPKQPTPKADPAAVSNAHKMAEEAVLIDEKLTDDAKKKIQTALGPKNSQMRKTSASARAIIGLAKTNPANTVKKEEVEGSVPHTPKEKELAAKSGNKKRITFGDVLKARGVHKEGFMDTMKKIGKKVVDTVGHKDDKDLLDDLRKQMTPSPATSVPAAKAKPAKPKSPMASSYVKEDEEKNEKKETAAQEKAEKKKMKMENWNAMLKKVKDDSEEEKKEKGTEKFDKKKTTTGTFYSRKSSTFTNGTADKPSAKNEEVESVTVKHEQYGTGKTLPQFAEDLSWVDVMFDEGIKRVDVEDLELIEATAVHPKAIHVSDAGGGKYKVHAVGKEFAHGIKVGEHLTDTHLDDFSEMGGKVKMVKPSKKD